MNKLIEHFKQLKKEDRIMVFLIFTTIGNIFIALLKFVLSLTSIMLTQIVLLDTYANTKVYNSNLMNGLTGMGIGIVIIILGLYMIIGINKLRKMD